MKVLSWSSMEQVYDIVAAKRNIDPSELLLTYRGIPVMPTAFPAAIGLTNGCTLQAHDREDYTASKEAELKAIEEAIEEGQDDGGLKELLAEQLPSENLDMVKIVFASGSSHMLGVDMNESIQSVASRAAKWNNGVAPKLYFDGELLDMKSTLASSEIESGDALEGR
ncbi:hypothetical protein HDV03_004419 [Kappamyces sp. JEL0829]|nr:hypothetical protein HDV03_004419 [Kappamyces sp. JEL0829]